MFESSPSVALLRPGGRIARRHPAFEPRPQQLAMAGEVERALCDKRHLLVEAGTGVGKSFAYLVPAILRAVTSKAARPVVISTATIALQEQLIKKDIPFLQRVLGLEFSAVLAKGRGNYLSKRRLDRTLGRTRSRRNVFEEARAEAELERLVDWSAVTRDGSRSDMEFEPLPSVWEEVASDRNDCMGARCPTCQECFFYRARTRMFNAHLLIVNHHLLFADLALKRDNVSYLPDYKSLIIDEAHELEAVAGEYLGVNVSRGAVRHLLATLRHPKTERGLLSDYPFLVEPLLPLVRGAHHASEALFERASYMFQNVRGNRLRLEGPLLPAGELPDRLSQIALALRKAREAQEDDEIITKLEGVESRARTTAEALLDFCEQRVGTDQVYWLEGPAHPRSDNIVLRSAPIHVGPVLRPALFEQTESVIMASATLATGSSRPGHSPFAFIRGRLGLGDSEENDHCEPEVPAAIMVPAPQPGDGDGDGPEADDEDAVDEELEQIVAAATAMAGRKSDDPDGAEDAESGVRELLLGSPFDYASQAAVRLYPRIPDPRVEGYQGQFENTLLELVREFDGGTLVLFTSYSQLRTTAEALRPALQLNGFTLLQQGEGMQRNKMIEALRKGGRCVLFGVDSFWQGVDVPGDALRCVVIAKLPFPVPGEPLMQARMEDIDGRGGNSFSDLLVPLAIIRLKQGFGRLIRGASDRGIVAILDSRIVHKSYGRRFLQALPPAKVEKH